MIRSKTEKKKLCFVLFGFISSSYLSQRNYIFPNISINKSENWNKNVAGWREISRKIIRHIRVDVSQEFVARNVSVFGVFLVRILENTDQKNSEYRHILLSVMPLPTLVQTQRIFRY